LSSPKAFKNSKLNLLLPVGREPAQVTAMPAQAMAKPAQMMAGSSRGNGLSALAMADPVQVVACLAQATANPAQAKEKQAEAVQPSACGTREMMPQLMVVAKYAKRPLIR
jgi:hypothetical protein